MKTLHGPLDKGVWFDPSGSFVARVSFGGKILTVPEGSDKLFAMRIAKWFMTGEPVTIDVDEDQVIRRLKFQSGAYSVEFWLPDGPIQFTVPEDAPRAASGRARESDCL